MTKPATNRRKDSRFPEWDRKTVPGTILYLSSESELRELYEPLFHVEQMRAVEVSGKTSPHMAVKALMARKDL